MSGTPIEKLMNVSLGLRKPFPDEVAKCEFDEDKLVIYNRAGGEVLGFIDTNDQLYDANGNWFARKGDI